MSMTIAYGFRNGAFYVNTTNRCPCACRFCLRSNAPGILGSESLWLEREPTVEEIWADVSKALETSPREMVFCGYGEPTERLDALLEIAARAKAKNPGLKVRVNTNGLSDLIAGRPTAALFERKVDTLSISLNTDDPAEYLDVCRPKFGEAAYPAMLAFAREAVRHVPEVVMTVVGEPVTDAAKQERCRKIAEGLGAKLRVRPYEGQPAPAVDA
jgi:TatD family-associated radical SAM protein